MTRGVITADEGTTVVSLARLMGEKRIGSVVITRSGEPVGIFTERDLLTTFLARGRSMEVVVGEVCSSPLVAISSGMSIHEAATIMAARRIKRLPIAEDERLVGIITARDLVEAYAR
jgi:CBS domain-containing protein